MNSKPEVRLRRAYFDTRFGQLHVRTAFPGTGGFDEHTTLICVHGAGASSRVFGGFLALMAQDRSVYAPDRPGHGESDGEQAASGIQAHAQALADLAQDLRLRRIDLLCIDDAAAVAAALAADKPELVHAVVILAQDPRVTSPAIRQPMSLLRFGAGATEFPDDVFESRPAQLAKAVRAFLDRA